MAKGADRGVQSRLIPYLVPVRGTFLPGQMRISTAYTRTGTLSKDPMRLATTNPKSVEGHQALKEGRYTDAELIFREIAADIRKLFGAEHIEMAIALQGLVKALEGQHKLEEALKYQEQASEVLLHQRRP